MPPEGNHGVALVTGATGYLGGRLARRLLAVGRRVVVLARLGADTSALEADGIAVIRDDGSTAGLAAAVAACAPQSVFHLAARFVARHTIADVDDLVASNLGLPTRLAEATVAAGCRVFVTAGTAWQLDADGHERPHGLYAAMKQAAESIYAHYAASDGLKVACLRLYETWGPADPRRKLLPLLLSTLRSGETLALSPGEQRLDFVHVDDVIAAFLHAEARLHAAEPGRFERFSVRTGRPVSIRELVAHIERAAGRPLPVAFGARPYRPDEIMFPPPGEILPGWQARISWDEGLAPLVAEG